MATSNEERLVDQVVSSSDVRQGIAALARVILDRKATPAERYTAERSLILAVEQTVASYAG